MVNELRAKVPELSNGDPNNPDYAIPSEQLDKLINNLSDVHGLDVNLYNLQGDMIVSSNPFIYIKGILSKKMNPLAYYQMHMLNSVEFFNEEQMGRLSFQSVYCPLRVGNGKV